MNRFIQIYRATLVIKIILCIEITSHVCISLLKTVQWFRLTKPNLRWSGRGIKCFPLRWQIFLTWGRVRIVWTWGGGGGGGSGGGGGVGCGGVGGGVFNHSSVCRKEPLQMLNIGLYGSRAWSKTYDLRIGCVCVCVSRQEWTKFVCVFDGWTLYFTLQAERKQERKTGGSVSSTWAAGVPVKK